MKRRGVACCSMALAAAAAAIVAGFAIGRPKSLLDYATPVADYRAWQDSRVMNPELLEYCWLSPTEVLYLGAKGSASAQLMRKRIDRAAEPAKAIPARLPFGATNWQVSPDGKWICWSGPGSLVLPIQSRYHVLSLDGTTARAIGSNGMDAEWSEDCTSIYTRSPAGERAIRKTSISSGRFQDLATPEYASQKNISGSMASLPIVMHVFKDGRILVAEHGPFYMAKRPNFNPRKFNTKSVEFVVYDVNNPSAPRDRWSVNAPVDTDNGYVRASPQGDKLFWTTSKMVVSPIDQAVHAIIRSHNVRPCRLARLMISDIHGHGIHSIAEYWSTPLGDVTRMLWTPDGKQISFSMNGRLYTIPAD